MSTVIYDDPFDLVIDALFDALEADPADVLTRLALADAYEETGEEGLAAAHRKLAGLRPQARLTDDDREEIIHAWCAWAVRLACECRLHEEFDEELLVWWFRCERIDLFGNSANDDGEEYVAVEGQGDLCLCDVRKLAGI